MKILKIYVYLNTVFWNSFKNMYYIFQWKNLQKNNQYVERCSLETNRKNLWKVNIQKNCSWKSKLLELNRSTCSSIKIEQKSNIIILL